MDKFTIEGKSAERVPKGYTYGSEDWKAEYNMLLMDGVTCKSCMHCNRCVSMFGQKETAKKCQFYPNIFSQKGGTNG